MDKYTELDTMREGIVHRATYLLYTPPTMIRDMIAYTTKLQEVLVAEGLDCTYTPCYDEYHQYVVVKVGGSLNHISVYLFHSYSPSFSPDYTPHSEFRTVQELLDNLRAAEVRYREALHRAPLEEALWEQCTTCYYGAEGRYCGAGLERVRGCLEHTTQSYE